MLWIRDDEEPDPSTGGNIQSFFLYQSTYLLCVGPRAACSSQAKEQGMDPRLCGTSTFMEGVLGASLLQSSLPWRRSFYGAITALVQSPVQQAVLKLMVARG